MSKNEKNKDLSMAYGMSKRKKYAKGGQIPPSAKTEKRPSPDQRGEETARNSGDKAPHMDKATSQPERKQSMRGPMTTKLKHPSMAQSPVFKVKLRDEEDDMMSSDAPASPEDEIREPMAKGGKVDKLHQGAQEARKYLAQKQEKGINTPRHPYPHNKESMGESRAGYSAKDSKRPEMAAQAKEVHEKTLSEMRSMPKPKFAEGGEISETDGGAEESMDHDSSLVDAIMARRDQLHDEIDSGAHDLDSAVRMAEGGEADLDMNAEEQPNDFYGQNEDAVLKENYDEGMDDASQPEDSNEHGRKIMSDEDDQDMVDKIRNKRRQR